jgi:hypothetical protein
MKKGPLTTTGDLSACKSKRTLIQLLTVNSGAPRRGDGSIVGAAGVATAGGAPCWLACNHACKLDGDRAFALPGRKVYPGGSASAHGGWNAGELGSGCKLVKRGDLTPLGVRVRVHGCTGAWVRAKECAVHTDVKTASAARTAAATRSSDERTEKAKERTTSGLHAQRSRQRHLQENASQPRLKASITQRDGTVGAECGPDTNQ